MKSSILFLAIACAKDLAFASDNSCADSSHTASDEEVSGLMQAASRMQLTLPVNQQEVIANHRKNGEVSTLQSLAAVRAQIHGIRSVDMHPAKKAKLRTQINHIESAHAAELQAEHSADSVLWKKELAKHALCHSNMQAHWENGGTVFRRAAQVTIAKTKHKKCAKASKSWSSYSTAARGGDDVATFMESIPSHDALCAALSTMETDVADYTATPPISSILPKSCEADQGSFEDSVCSWHTAKSSACETEQECLAVIDLATTKTTLTSKSSARRELKLDMRTTACKMLHGLDQIGATGDVVEHTCDEKLDANDLVLTMTIPESQHCGGEEEVFPSATTCEAFRKQEYEPWTKDHVKPQHCVANCDPTKRTTTTTTTKCLGIQGEYVFFEGNTRVMNLAEVKINGKTPTRGALSSNYKPGLFPASNCFDNSLTNFCHTREGVAWWAWFALDSAECITNIQIWNRLRYEQRFAGAVVSIRRDAKIGAKKLWSTTVATHKHYNIVPRLE